MHLPTQSLPAYPPQAPPPAPRRARRPRRRRRGCFWQLTQLGLVTALLGVCLAALLVAAYIIFPPPRMNILVMGVDARPQEGYVTRSDTNILVTVDASQPYIGMLSIPRDLYVNIPGFGYARINAAHIYGENAAQGYGADLMAQTIANNFNVPVHRTLRMNFRGFVAIVDAAGGIDIDVPGAIYDYAYPTEDYGTMEITFEQGRQHMDGERALQYARTRHGSSDFRRAERQQQIIVALFRKLFNPVNWWRIPAVYTAIITNVETDLTLFDAAMLAPTVLWVGPEGVDRRVMSRENNMVVNADIPGDPYLLAPNWYAINPMLDEVFRR
jgi:LCP family protein required for cell wall assembly